MKPKPWTDVYPQGTPQGNDEQDFFIILARSKSPWLSVDEIANKTGLNKRRVEQIIAKYSQKNMVIQHERHDNEWAYWERVPDRVPSEEKSILDLDHENRMRNFGSDGDDGLF